MSENIKKSNKLDNLIGILLIMPIYMIVFVLLNVLNLNNGDNLILFPTLMYLPVIIGIVLSYKLHGNKVSNVITVIILGILVLAICFYYDTYFVEHSGWDGLGSFFLWLITSAVCKIVSCVFYGKIVGAKKSVLFLFIYVIVIVCSFLLGFWA